MAPIGERHPEPAALRVKEACAYLNIGKSRLYKELKAGKIKARKLHNTTLIMREECDRYLRDNTTSWTGETAAA